MDGVIAPQTALMNLLGRHTLLDPETCARVADEIVKELDLSIEEAHPKGLEWLSVPSLWRIVGGWRGIVPRQK